jgi:hypothetical protein
MTQGYWLWHAPESFIMASTAIHVDRHYGSEVYMDCTTKKMKIKQNMDDAIRGRPQKRKRRYDLVVFKKASDRVRAIIEIKKADTLWHLWSDRKKLHRYLKRNNHVAVYLLVYTEAVGDDRRARLAKIEERGVNWARDLDCVLVGKRRSPRSDYKDEYDWAFYLFRLKA